MSERQTQVQCRSGVMGLLSEDEQARLAGSIGKPLAAGDEYLDLTDLDCGVRRASVACSALAGLLPRAVVQARTWTEILVYLNSCRR